MTGIVQGDLGNLAIYQDDNNDGTIEAGETTTAGGSGSVNSGVTTITFSSSFNIAASTTVNYILIGDVANLAVGDTMTIALSFSNFTLSSGAVGGSTTNATHTAGGIKVTYSAATSGTSWTVPSGVTGITVKSWGAGGGGGGGNSSNAGGNGVGAGFAQATFSVTPGETLTLRVGGGGSGGTNDASYAGGGGGGGYSGVFRSSTALIIAAGGGGGGGGGGSSNGAYDGTAGGVGGGTTGGPGVSTYGYGSGKGGTQSAGGAAGNGGGGAGSSLSGGQGAQGNYPYGGAGGAGGTNGGGSGGAGDDYYSLSGGGGGGAGYFGGGGGSLDYYYYSYYGACGGGGGSSYMTGTNTSTSSGNNANAGNTTDSDYSGSAGQGGSGGPAGGGYYSNGANGNAGLVVIRYLSAPTVVFLASFTATWEGSGVLVEWVTKTEIDNVGFNLYRSTGAGGTYIKLNQEMIPGLLSSVNGRAYTFYDANVTPGNVYCYQLEDINLRGERTMHGPVCVGGGAGGGGGVGASGLVTSGGKSQGTPGSGSIGSTGKAGSGSSGSNAGNSNGFVNGMNGNSTVTQVGMKDLGTSWTGEGILVEWRTGYEVNNLGFHVYREEGKQVVRLTPELVAGSALRYRAGTLTAGYSYSWLDVSPVRPALSSVQYWVEDVDLSGKKTWHGPVSVSSSDQPLSRKSQSALLSHLSRLQAQADPDAAKVQALQARLGRNHRSVLGSQNLSFGPPGSADQNIEVQGVDDGTGGGFPGGLIPSIISDRPPRSPNDLQWALAASGGVKIYIQKEGWYRITQPELVAAGLSSSINPRSLRLFVDGQEQALGVSAGVGNQFGPQDFVEFYATGLDTPFTDTRVYWLIWGSAPGKRIGQVDGTVGSGGQGPATSFPFTVEDKPRTVYFAALLNGDASNMFGPLVATAGVQQVMSVQHLDPAAPGAGTLEVTLQGVTVNPHQVQILVNGVVAGVLNFSNQSEGSTTVSLSSGVLQEGDNVVQLSALGGDMDLSLIDTLQLTYWHTYTADSDVLRLTAVGGSPLIIGGFSSSQVRVMDITDPGAVQEILGSVQAQGAGYSIQLTVPGSGMRTFLAFAPSQVQNPGAVEGNQPSNWHQAGRVADLVIITHGDFLENLESLKALREAQGFSVALIDVEDLYDEFSFGEKTPQAMKDFLIQTRTFWKKAPGYVLLVGDASFDPRNYLGMGSFDFVPTKLIDTAYLETASDDWFVDFDGDGLPEMAVGRISVRTVQEASTVVSKIVGYEQGSGGSQAVLLVADINDTFDFENAAASLESLLPAQLTVQEIFRSRYGDDDQVHAALLQDINQGALLVNYVGHGSVEVWRGSYFDSDYAEALTNGMGLPFFLDMTCLNGYFQDVYTESLAEALLKAEQGGAVAVWASSGLTEPENQEPMNQELIRLLFSSGSLTLGQATAQAKKAANDQDVRRTWIFFGDPTTRLKY